ncbi:MAG: dienelactone hydrolase family protein, partial [Casimicrobiaceae bacterium]
MARMRADDFPPEVLKLFDGYIHGLVSRRDFLERATRYATVGFGATAMLEALTPNYALAAEVAKDDPRIVSAYVTYDVPEGSGTMRGYLVHPAQGKGPWPGVVVVHENRGLNPYIEDVARRLGTENFMAFAPDSLTSVGGYPGDEEKGVALFAKLDRDKMTEDFVAAANWLRT